MNEFLPVIVVGTVGLLVVARRRLVTAIQPLRLEMARTGECLLARGDVPPHVKARVESMMGMAFGARLHWIMIVVSVPFVLLLVGVRPRILLDAKSAFTLSDPTANEMLQRLVRLEDRIAMVNHPILYFFAMVQVLLFLPLLLIGMAVWSGRMAEATKETDRYTVIALIEAKEDRFFRRWRAHAA